MAKFSGVIGFSTQVESQPGVWVDTIVEKPYFGDVLRSTRKLTEGEGVNDNLTVNNTISVVSDPYASGHINDIRYVSWQGSLWKVTDVEVQRPRLLLRLGGVWNGNTV